MFYLIFGSIWMIVTSYMIFTFYDPSQGTTYMINNEIVTYEEFTQDIWLKLFFGFVFLLGLIIFIVGLRMIIRNYLTNKHGKSAIGFLLKIEPNGQKINEEPVFDVIFLVFEEGGKCNLYRENIGTRDDLYLPGRFYEVKYYKNDINILSRIDESQIPPDKLKILLNAVNALQNS